MEHIIKTVSDYFNIPIKDLKGRSRKREIVLARYMCFKIIRGKKNHNKYKWEGYKYSFAEIGSAFNKDHVTVMYGIKTLNELMAVYPKIKENYEIILSGKFLTMEQEIINNAVSCAQL